VGVAATCGAGRARIGATDERRPTPRRLPSQKIGPAPERFRSDRRCAASSRYRRGDSYEEQQAADQADEARLKRKLIICQNCSSSGN